MSDRVHDGKEQQSATREQRQYTNIDEGAGQHLRMLVAGVGAAAAAAAAAAADIVQGKKLD